MKKLMLLTLLCVLFLSCKSSNDMNPENSISNDVVSYDIQNNTICCDRSYGVLIKDNEEKIYFLGEAAVLVEKADLKTFKAYDGFKKIDDINYDAEDKNNYYRVGKIVKKK